MEPKRDLVVVATDWLVKAMEAFFDWFEIERNANLAIKLYTLAGILFIGVSVLGIASDYPTWGDILLAIGYTTYVIASLIVFIMVTSKRLHNYYERHLDKTK